MKEPFIVPVYKSSKFWTPFVVSLLLNAVWFLYAMASMGTDSKSDPSYQAVGNAVFPALGFMDFIYRYMGTVPALFAELAILSVFFQMPFYGFLIGWCWAKGKLLFVLSLLFGLHVGAFVLTQL